MREVLKARIADFQDRSLAGDSTGFDELLLAVHRWQRSIDPVVRALGGPAERWDEIPAVPVDVFKYARVGTCRQGGRVFRTSGTTVGQRGEHWVEDTELYDRGALAWANLQVPQMPRRIVALLSDPAEAPDSSLSHMVALFGDVSWHVYGGKLDSSIPFPSEPVFLTSTAFAMFEFLERGAQPLPPGSAVMVTGGFKGKVHSVTEEQLFDRIRAVLRPDHFVVEYGMTELSSQLWSGAGEPYRPPPWLRVVAVNPQNGQIRPAGELGQLRFYDLANLDSTVAVETMDQGVVHADGTVTLHGRIPGSAIRGCSLTIEEGWE